MNSTSALPIVPSVFLIEGLDRLGKSTLVEGLINKLGYYQRLHFSKPLKVDRYKDAKPDLYSDVYTGVTKDNIQLFEYQKACFMNMFLMASGPGRFICDRAHLGEAVYANLYRGYDGNYVFGMERYLGVDTFQGVRLILLTEDFKSSRHFVDDGQSLGPKEARQQEQKMFVDAFDKSIIYDKRVICVTDEDGSFRPTDAIVKDALSAG
jgi:hypothetical protein